MKLRALALISLSLASTAVANAPSFGQIESNTMVRRDGFRIGCNSALLIPRSAMADRNVGIVFGNLEQGTADLAKLSGADLKYRLPGTREGVCHRLRPKGHYLFSDVPAGEYYVVLRFERQVGTSDVPNAPTFAGLLMQRAIVKPGATVRLRFE